MGYHIYFRILGYIVTITMHVSNVVVMNSSFHGEPMKNYFVKHFSEMQCFFFTCWTFTFQTVYAIIGLYTDILMLKNSKSADYELPKLLVDCRDSMFTIMVWPCSLMVFTTFWIFFHYDRSLFFPEDIDLVITNTSNHIMHTYIIPPILWEVMFRRREVPKSHMWHVLGVWLVAASYLTVLLLIHAIRGVWVYPIFGIMAGSIYFHLFFGMVVAVIPFLYYSQWTLTSIVWGSRGNLKQID